jgi:hypothetical protein
MIIKSMDSKQEELEELSSFLKEELTPSQRFFIEGELRRMKSGLYGEKDAAYYLDYDFGDSKNWAVIHDMRIEHANKVAQIDHLLINRLFDMYILESKNFFYGIKITPKGEFQIYNGKRYVGISSPIEQNKRHIHLLNHFLKDHEILPKRMGITIRPKFKNVVLVSPYSIIRRPPENKFNTSMVIKADTLRTKIDEEVDKMHLADDLTSISKISSIPTVEEVAKKITSYHKPIKIDYRAKFGLPEKAHSKYYCFKCRKSISKEVAKSCWEDKSKFGGKAYCIDCQKGLTKKM